MNRRIITAFGMVLACVFIANAGDPRELTPASMDSREAIGFVISYIEAGFQRGEIKAAIKRFSDAYSENGISISHKNILTKLNEIFDKKNSKIQTGEITGGVYFEIKSLEIKEDIANVSLIIFVYFPSETGNPKKIESELIFEKSGGAWLLKSSDGLLERISYVLDEEQINAESSTRGVEK